MTEQAALIEWNRRNAGATQPDDALVVERVKVLFKRWHRDSCYPYASDYEAEQFAREAIAALSRPADRPVSGLVKRIRNRIHDAPLPTEHMLDDAAEELTRLTNELADAKAKMRCIISHASGGHTDDTSLTLNDICVRISQHHNRIWEHAQEKPTAELAKRDDEKAQIVAWFKRNNSAQGAVGLIDRTMASRDDSPWDVAQAIAAAIERGDHFANTGGPQR